MFDLFNIIGYFKKKFNRCDLIIGLMLLLFFFVTRLINLDRFPIFCDEGIYIHWAKIAWHDASWRFISLTDGKQPLQTWATIPFLKLFPDNALLAGRLFSVVSGLVALIGIFTLLYYLFGKKAAFFGSFLYIFTPYFLFYDRMALTDSAVNAGFIWVLFFSILLINTLRLDVALIFGIASGMTLLTKSSSQMFLMLSIFSPIILIFDKGLKKNILKIINYIILFIFVTILALVIYNIQRLSPFLHYVALKNNTFVMSFSEFIKAPFSLFFSNLKIVPLYVFWESGWLIPIFGIIGLVFLYKKIPGLFIYFLIWIVLSSLAICLFSKVVFPRYLIFFASLFVIFTSYLISQINNKILIVIFSLLFISFVYLDYPILFNFQTISFPPVDRGQYVEGVTTGWHVQEIIDFARNKSTDKPVILLAEGNFGLIGDMLDVFLKKTDKITIKGYWPLDEKELLENQKELGQNYVYVVFSHRTDFPENWPIKLIKKFEKPGNKSNIYLYQLI